MEKIWFVYNNSIVEGPYSTNEVQSGLKGNRWHTDSFIWWRGQREWMTLKDWETQSPRILENQNQKVQSPVWYIENAGSSIGPLTQNEMMGHVKGIADLSKVRLWTVGMSNWTNIFDLHNIMDELGVSRREHTRAPLMGTVTIVRELIGGGSASSSSTVSSASTSTNQNSSTSSANTNSATMTNITPTPLGSEPMQTKAASISLGGLGVNDAYGLARGDEVSLLVKSSEFPGPLRAKATVVYVSSQGYAGLKFHGVHPEMATLIIDYVRKFSNKTEGNKEKEKKLEPSSVDGPIHQSDDATESNKSKRAA